MGGRHDKWTGGQADSLSRFCVPDVDHRRYGLLSAQVSERFTGRGCLSVCPSVSCGISQCGVSCGVGAGVYGSMDFGGGVSGVDFLASLLSFILTGCWAPC